MTKIIPDNLMYAKSIQKMRIRSSCKSTDFSDILPEEVCYHAHPPAQCRSLPVRSLLATLQTYVHANAPAQIEHELKEAAEISMGTDVSDEDAENILMLTDQVISLSEYRTQLWDYLKNRMQAIAPNLSVMVGELVGARLIAHAGSLMNLAKQPASTVQILGAEKVSLMLHIPGPILSRLVGRL